MYASNYEKRRYESSCVRRVADVFTCSNGDLRGVLETVRYVSGSLLLKSKSIRYFTNKYRNARDFRHGPRS